MGSADYPIIFNIVISLVFLAPLLMMIWAYKQHPPKYFGLLFWSIAIIFWSVAGLNLLSETLEKLISMTPLPAEHEEVNNKIISNLRLWVVVAPAISLAVAANLISEFLFRNRPDSK
ncbi:hypothetical protein [Endozoicomonas sp. ALC020]|uniref:hypothetical protein n=1 Tax=unclassified Endozoicomonas TaxID=2644528 RepID=UPI003BB093B9